MAMIRMLCVVLAAAACGALGIIAALRLQKRARRLGQWREAFLRLQGALQYAAFSLPAALKYAALPDMPVLALLEGRLRDAPGEQLSKLFAAVYQEDCLKPEDERAVRAGIEGLDAVTLEEQCARLALSVSRLERYEEGARQENERLARLFMSGGCLGGAALMILLL